MPSWARSNSTAMASFTASSGSDSSSSPSAHSGSSSFITVRAMICTHGSPGFIYPVPSIGIPYKNHTALDAQLASIAVIHCRDIDQAVPMLGLDPVPAIPVLPVGIERPSIKPLDLIEGIQIPDRRVLRLNRVACHV